MENQKHVVLPGRISNFLFIVTDYSFRFSSVLLFFLSKKVTKPCLPARQERTPPPITPSRQNDETEGSLI
jgi:hypothetical protein